MFILDKVKIGNSVQINLELSRDRLTKETIDAINVSSLGKISDFRITDGKGIGVVLQLSNGQEQWFFEDEIDLLDENGNVIKKNYDKQENSNFIFDFLRGLNYENKNNVSELLNPINFFIWLVVSFKDIFWLVKNFSKIKWYNNLFKYKISIIKNLNGTKYYRCKKFI